MPIARRRRSNNARGTQDALTVVTQAGHAAMYNVTEFPVDNLSDRELRIREWEVVMAGGYGSNEHKRLQNELWRRTSNFYAPARPMTH